MERKAGGPHLIVDADVLIDFFASDPSLLKLASEEVGQIHVVRDVLDEVAWLSEDMCASLGLIVDEIELAQARRAAVKRGSLSFPDRVCLILAKTHRWICVSNDTRLRKECRAEGIPGFKPAGQLGLRRARVSHKPDMVCLNSLDGTCLYRLDLHRFLGFFQILLPALHVGFLYVHVRANVILIDLPCAVRRGSGIHLASNHDGFAFSASRYASFSCRKQINLHHRLLGKASEGVLPLKGHVDAVQSLHCLGRCFQEVKGLGLRLSQGVGVSTGGGAGDGPGVASGVAIPAGVAVPSLIGLLGGEISIMIVIKVVGPS